MTAPICDLTREETEEIAAPLSVETYLELIDPSEVPSRAARRELLDAAFLYVLAELGTPLNDAGWDVFHDRVDTLFRLSLLARRPMRPEPTDWQLRAAVMAQMAREL